MEATSVPPMIYTLVCFVADASNCSSWNDKKEKRNYFKSFFCQ